MPAPALEYVPGEQSAQSVLDDCENVPAMQTWQTELPVADEKLPALHSTHSSSDDAPSVAEYLPSRHGLQTDPAVAPVSSEYFPLAQFVQTLNPVWLAYFPSTHCVQSVGSPAPAEEEDLPSGQDVHPKIEDRPGLDEYFPGAQSKHASNTLLENFPTSQVWHAVDPAAVATMPAAHTLQANFESAPIRVENFPAMHSVHTADPGADEYLPAAQFTQLELKLFGDCPAGH